MSAEHLEANAEDAKASIEPDAAAEAGQRALKEALAAAEKLVADAARSVERAIREGVEAIRSRTGSYSGPGVDEAQRYVIERVKERPVTATLAGLGVGFLLGVLLSSRGK